MRIRDSKYFISVALLLLLNIVFVAFAFWYIQSIRFYGEFNIFVKENSTNVSSDFECTGITFTGKREEIPLVDSSFCFNGKKYFAEIEITPKSDQKNQVNIFFISDKNKILSKEVFYNTEIIRLDKNYLNGTFFTRLFQSGFLISSYFKVFYFLVLVIASIVVIIALFFYRKNIWKISPIILTLTSFYIFIYEVLLKTYPGIWTGVWLYSCLFFLLVTLISRLRYSKKHLTNALISLCTIILIFTLSEIFLRLTKQNLTNFELRFGYYKSEFDQKIITNNCFYEPFSVHYLESKEFKFKRESNSLGLSDVEPELKYSDDDFLIIGLGDSFTEGDGAHQDSTWLKFLEYNLVGKDSVNYKSINAGICGSDPFYSLRLFEDKLLQYNPDLVILTIGSDLEDIILRGGMDRFERKTPRLKAPKWELVYQHSFIFRRMYHSYNNKYPLFLNESTFEKEKERAEEELKELLLYFEDLSEENGFELLIVFYPVSVEIRNESYNHWNELIMFCKYSNIEYLNLLKYYLLEGGINQNNVSEFFWKSDGHHNAKGYEKFAEGVLWKLQQMEF